MISFKRKNQGCGQLGILRSLGSVVFVVILCFWIVVTVTAPGIDQKYIYIYNMYIDCWLIHFQKPFGGEGFGIWWCSFMSIRSRSKHVQGDDAGPDKNVYISWLKATLVAPGDSLWPFHPVVGGHLTIWKGHLTIPKRSKNCQANIVFQMPW